MNRIGPRGGCTFYLGGLATLVILALIGGCSRLRAQTPAPVTPGYQICVQPEAGVTTKCSFQPLDLSHPLPFVSAGNNVVSGNGAGSTGAVVGTLAAVSGKRTYICGFNVQAIGGTATVGPVTIAGLIGASQVYQTDVNSATVGKTVASANFTPCIPASADNTVITVTTTANGTATAVDVNSWGLQQ